MCYSSALWLMKLCTLTCTHTQTNKQANKQWKSTDVFWRNITPGPPNSVESLSAQTWIRSERKCKKRSICLSVPAYVCVSTCTCIYLSHQYKESTMCRERERMKVPEKLKIKDVWLYFHEATQCKAQPKVQHKSQLRAGKVAFSQLPFCMKAFLFQLINGRSVIHLQSLIGVRHIVKLQLCTPDPPAKSVQPAPHCCKITTLHLCSCPHHSTQFLMQSKSTEGLDTDTLWTILHFHETLRDNVKLSVPTIPLLVLSSKSTG